jgi:MurNAc alpha-1-phosphate uridylyltransferase
MSLPVAILAGGLATRLHPITARIPKSLVEVAGRPFVEHQIRLLRSSGFTDLVFLVGHMQEAIRAALGDGSRGGVRIRYVSDGPFPRGTGGAIQQALGELGNQFLVMYGDSYLECDYSAVERALTRSGKSAVMTVYRNENRWDRSNVVFDDGRIVKYDKQAQTSDMRHIDYGLGAFHAHVFTMPGPDEAFDLATVYRQLIANGDLAGLEVKKRFFEIGSPAGLDEIHAYLTAKGTI